MVSTEVVHDFVYLLRYKNYGVDPVAHISEFTPYIDNQYCKEVVDHYE